jgi:hypothetical protein
MAGLAKNGFKKPAKTKGSSKKMKTPILFRSKTFDDWRAMREVMDIVRSDFYIHTVKDMDETLKGAPWEYLHIDINYGQFTIGISNGSNPVYELRGGPQPLGNLSEIIFYMKKCREEMLYVQNEFSKSIQ